MKIAVVGCGAVGSFYGARLLRAGEDVCFLLRSDFEAVRSRGLQVFSPEGDFLVWPRCAREPQTIGICDLVLIGLKTTANAELVKLLPPLVASHTLILTLQNGLGNEEWLAGMSGPENILGGLCFVCLNRISPGIVQHLAHGKIVLGEFCRAPQPRTHAIAELFRCAAIECDVTENLERAHWEKLVWNIPFNGLGVASSAGYEAVARGHARDLSPRRACLTTDQLLGDARWAQIVRDLMDEIIVTANALGLRVAPAVAEEQIARTRIMGAYNPSTLIDYERGQPLERESMFERPLRIAREVGVPTPRLEALCAVLQRLSPS